MVPEATTANSFPGGFLGNLIGTRTCTLRP